MSLPSKNFENFETGANGTKISSEKFLENPEIVAEFPKSKPRSSDDFWIFGRKLKWNKKTTEQKKWKLTKRTVAIKRIRRVSTNCFVVRYFLSSVHATIEIVPQVQKLLRRNEVI